jgi:hypothetical protein
LLLSILSPAPAQAARGQANPAVGGFIAGHWVGTWQVGGVDAGVCHEFGQNFPNSSGFQTKSGTFAGLSPENAARAKHLDNTYFGTRDSGMAQAWQLAAWKLQGLPEFNKWYKQARQSGQISDSLHRTTKRMLRESRRHGPYTVTVGLHGGAPGKVGTVAVSVRTLTGKPAPAGMRVGLAGAGPIALARTSTVTGRSGVASTRYRMSRMAPHQVSATVHAPSHTQLRVTTPSPGRQLLGGSRSTQPYRGVASVQSAPQIVGPTMTAQCTTNCTGKNVPVDMKICSQGPGIIKINVGTGKQQRTFVIKGSGCVTKRIRLNDGDVVPPGRACYVARMKGPCITPPFPVRQSDEVVCPGWPRATVCVDGNCSGKNADIVRFWAPDNTRTYTGWYAIGTKPAKTVPLVKGWNDVVLKQNVGPGTRVLVGFSAYRDANRSQKLSEGQLLDITIN